MMAALFLFRLKEISFRPKTNTKLLFIGDL